MRKRREGVAAATADPAYYMRSPPAISAVPFHYLLIFKISLSSSTKSVQSKEEVEMTFCFCLCVLRRAALACIIILSVFRPPLCQTSSARWHCRHVGLGMAQVFFLHEALLHDSWFMVDDPSSNLALGDIWTVLRKTHWILCILDSWVEWWPN